jgi:serine/threonine-protein kinase HipA
MTKPARVKELYLHTTQGDAGELIRESQFVVRYNDEALRRPVLAVSLTMPPRPQGWSSNQLPPVLAMNLPEGFLRDRVVERYRKVMDIEDMNLLAVTSTPSAGRVWASAAGTDPADPGKPIALREILAHRGTEELFDELLEKYSSSSISGIQPKVVVPERTSSNPLERSAVKSPDLIVKSAGDLYPGLAENEFICMSIAKHVGLETPDFWLSDDRKLFVIRRFDIGPKGYLGFEDLAVLTGRHPDGKYDGSYGDAAKAVALNAAPIHRKSSLESFFRLMVINSVIRNGDAHLKNFGVLYGDPVSAEVDARLAPVYDLICSTLYIPNDVLALGMGGSKAWPDRKALEKFGKEACDVKKAAGILDEVIDLAMAYRHQDSKSRMWKRIRAEMETGVMAIRAQKGKRISVPATKT